MVDNSGDVRAKLDGLAEQVRKDNALWPVMVKYLAQVLHCNDPHPEAREWAVARMEEYAAHDMVAVARMAHEDPHPENRRAAGMVIVRNAQRMPDAGTRIAHLDAVAGNGRLHADARVEAGRLLDMERQLEQVRMLVNMPDAGARRKGLEECARNPLRCREARLEAGNLLLRELRKFTDITYHARTLMRDEALLRETRVAAAELVVDYFRMTQRGSGVVAEMVTSGEWPEIAEKTGILLVDYAISKNNCGEARRIEDAYKTPQAVKDYVEMKLGARPRKVTLTGMPAINAGSLLKRPKQAAGIPPAPGKATLRGRPGS